jgi:hypothetical protein
MNDAEETTLTYKQEAANFYGKDAVYRRVREEMDERINRFSRRQAAMKVRAETHAKLAQALYDDNLLEITVTVKARGVENFSYSITTLDDVREHIAKAKMLFERGILSDMDYLRAMIEEQEAIREHLTD